MSRKIAWLPLIVLLAVVGCSNEPRTSWDLAVTGGELAEANLGYYWQAIVPIAESQRIAKLWHMDENVYCLTDANVLWAYDAKSGAVKWSRDLGHKGQQYRRPFHMEDLALGKSLGPSTVVIKPTGEKVQLYDVAVINSLTEAKLLDRSDGKVLQTIDFTRGKFTVSSPVVCDSTRLYAGTTKGRYVSVGLIDGLRAWQLATEALISAAPVLMGDTLYIASWDGQIVATQVGHARGKKLWSTEGGALSGDPLVDDFVVDDRGIFIGCQDYSVYSLSPITGKLQWRFPTGGMIGGPVQVGQDNVYAYAMGDKFYALAVTPGRPTEKWTLPDGVMVLAEIGNDAYVLTNCNELKVVDAAVGTVRRVVPLSGLELFVPSTGSSAIFAANADGLLCRISPQSAGQVTPQMLKGK